jgi:uncharacterized protein (DUF433 family)
MRDDGLSLQEVGGIVGHSEREMTEHYSHLFLDDLQAKIERAASRESASV